MANYTIRHSCGCTVNHQIYGTNVHGERDRKIEWFKSVPCMVCKAKAEIEKAGEKTPLVKLTGSEKQIAWAEKIRAKWILELDERYSSLYPDTRAALIDVLNTVATTAKIWIDNRDKFGKSLTKDITTLNITEQMVMDRVAVIKAARETAEKTEEKIETVETPEAPVKKMTGREMAAVAMRRAWAIRRELHGKKGTNSAEWSAILKQAWADIKACK